MRTTTLNTTQALALASLVTNSAVALYRASAAESQAAVFAVDLIAGLKLEVLAPQDLRFRASILQRLATFFGRPDVQAAVGTDPWTRCLAELSRADMAMGLAS